MGGGHGGGMPVQKALAFRASGLRFIKLLRPEAFRLSLGLALTVISVALSVVGPKLLGRATNLVFSGFLGDRIGQEMAKAKVIEPGTVLDHAQSMKLLEQAAAHPQANGPNVTPDMLDMMGSMDFRIGAGIDFTAVGHILVGVLVVYLASALAGYIQGLLVTNVIQNTLYRIRQNVEKKLSRLPLSYFDSQPKGEVLSRVTNDVDNMGQVLQQTMTQLLFAVFTLIGVFIMMLTISGWLTLVMLVSVPVAALITALIAKRSQPQFIKQWDSTGQLNSHVEEMYTGHALVKVFGHQPQAESEFEDRNRQLYESSFKAQAISMMIQPVMMFISNLAYVAVAVLGGLRVASGTMSLGDVQAFIQYSRQFSQPVGQIASMMNLLQSGVASAERVFELLDAEEQDEDPCEPTELYEVEGRVAFADVTFSYDPSTPLIENLNLTAKPGQDIAIVGPTGAGKTTLVNLLERFYEIQGGLITIDGENTRTMAREDLRITMGMVLQDTWLFKGTIWENIKFGRSDATDEMVLEAAKATYVDRFVHALPNGYETVIDEEASNLSAGEKQLLTIARAFVADPEILILDEATSSVDTRTEVLVQKAMKQLRQGRTSFVIAHRLSTIRDADLILVMDHGDIVEQGNHASLLAARGAYFRLYQSQFAGAVAHHE
ncbi:MAG: ABC transporter ATP-binding protein/permease [Micrococcales bacterium]|nr:ABC transporter ATP-binding protein/permease [Micrococcales bacterium]